MCARLPTFSSRPPRIYLISTTAPAVHAARSGWYILAEIAHINRASLLYGEKPLITAYSALVDGKRMDSVQCPEYVYLNGGELPRRVGPLEVQGAAWLKREGKGWLLIPCGKLGYWSPEQRVDRIPPDRGTPLLIVDLPALGLKEAQVTGLGEMGESVDAQTERLADGRLKVTASGKVRAYRLQAP